MRGGEIDICDDIQPGRGGKKYDTLTTTVLRLGGCTVGVARMCSETSTLGTIVDVKKCLQGQITNFN